MIMAQENNTEQNNSLIYLNKLTIQRLENIAQIIPKPNNLFDKLNKQIIDGMNKDREDAQYSKEQVLQMRKTNNNRLYKTPEDVNSINAGGYVWENGKCGYFIPFEHRGLGYDFMSPQFGGGQEDGKGLRFVQQHKDGELFVPYKSNDIIISGFGEYVLENWGKDLSKLCSEYTTEKYKERVSQWRKDNYPEKADKQTGLQLLNELKEDEQSRWEKASISEFFTANDNEKLNQCMNEYFNWFSNCIQMETNKEEKKLINFIKSGTLSNSWVNGKAGLFRDFDNNCLYRFCETDEECSHRLQREQEQRNSPVLACGFVAWLIKHWGTDTQTIYSGYLQEKIDQYKNEHKNDADVFKRDLEREFYDQYRAKEEQWVKQSEGIFDFISEPEANRIKEYVKYYFEYVCQSDTKTNPTPQPEAAEEGKANKVKAEQEQLDKLKLDKKAESQVLGNYNFWNNLENSKERQYTNIFKDITEHKFLEMVSTADFSELNKKGISQRVKCNVFVLSRLLNNREWGETAAEKLNTTLADCQKRTEFNEWELLKSKFLQ
jgi:hypothetical protein